MFFDLDEAKHVKNTEDLLQIIEETIAFIKEKGGDAKLLHNAISQEITFENGKYRFSLDVLVPLRN